MSMWRHGPSCTRWQLTQQTSLAPPVTSQLPPTKDGDGRRRDLDGPSVWRSLSLNVTRNERIPLQPLCTGRPTKCAVIDMFTCSHQGQRTGHGHGTPTRGRRTPHLLEVGRDVKLLELLHNSTCSVPARTGESSSSMCPCCDDVT